MYSVKELVNMDSKSLEGLRNKFKNILKSLKNKDLNAHEKAVGTVAAINIRRINKALAFKDANRQYNL